MRHHEFLSEDELFEINMSPSNLKKLVKDIPGARVGLEFEMIVPDTKVSGDDGDYENDYDYDERARSFSSIEDFFAGGDGNNSRRDVRNMIEQLKEQYYEWASEQRWQQWMDEGWDYFVEYIEDEWDEESGREDAEEQIRDENPEMDRDSEEYEELVLERAEKLKQEWLSSEWDNQGSNWDHARESWEDSADWPDEDDWLENEGYRYMSDLERIGHDHDVYWPHQTQQNSDEEDLESVAAEFEAATGMSAKYSGGYHSINRSDQASEGFYIIEPDGSLITDDSDDSGLEFVSPPLPVDQMMDQIAKVAAWAEERGCYTSKSNKTGLHMNVSVPGFDKDNLDFVKLALLLGDQHILKEFDRVSYTYAKSSFELLQSKIMSNPQMAEKGLEAMKKHFNIAASKAIHSGYTDKYTSINVKENRVEFRGPGGNYLEMFKTNPNKLFAPMMRFVVALEAAVDPEKYKDEYQKKLYKFLSKAVKSKDELELFTNYAAGKGFAQSAYKSFLKQRKSERELVKPGEGVKVGGRRSNPDGRWVLVRQHPTGNYIQPYAVEVLYRFNAANGKDADIVRDQYVQEYKPSFQVLIASDPDIKNGQPGDYEKNQEGNWGVYRKSDGQRMKYRGEYVIYKDRSKADAEEQLRALFATASTSAQIDDYELRRLSKFELYRVANGRPVEHDGKAIEFWASTAEEAKNKIARYVVDFAIPGETSTPGTADEFDVRSVLTPPAHTTTTQQRTEPEQPRTTATGEPQATAANGVPMWAIYRISDGEVVHRFADHVSQHTRTALSWLRDQNYENPAMLFRVRAMSQSEYSRAQDPTAFQNPPAEDPGAETWEIFDMRNGQVWGTIEANSIEQAELMMDRQIRHAGLNPDHYDARIHRPNRQQPQQQPAPTTFTGEWKIVDDSGQELHRFGGVGNVQADANRVAAQWIQNNPGVVYSGGISVLPVMGNQ